jgi:hypothetical protein
MTMVQKRTIEAIQSMKPQALLKVLDYIETLQEAAPPEHPSEDEQLGYLAARRALAHLKTPLSETIRQERDEQL